MKFKKMKSGFKILGIRALKDCHKDYCKNLQKGEVYKFYNNYTFVYKDPSDVNSEIVQIFDDIKKSFDIYNITKPNGKELKINISALVGKNGSGKSSIIELLLMGINNIAKFHYEYQTVENISKENSKKFAIEIYVFNDYKYKVYIDNFQVIIYRFDELKNSFIKLNSQGILYVNEAVLFYTIVLNYSAYSLNEADLGTWIKKLYHKNDSYQIPIVLTPLRKAGNIDINRENYLAKSRLLSNLLNKNESFRVLTEKNDKAVALNLSNNFDKLGVINDDYDMPDYNVVEEYVNLFLKRNGLEPNPNILDQEIVKKYIYKKLSRICLNYRMYWVFFDDVNGILFQDKLEDYYNQLNEDRSHRTIKLRQALNYYSFTCEFYKVGGLNLNTIVKNINELFEKQRQLNGQIELIDFTPPAFFDVDIVLTNHENTTKEIPENYMFNTLSSGEKQRIFSLSSILYHIYNIDSVHKDGNANTTNYKNINIIYDEVELYFHPEMQARYISALLKSISYIQLENIESINMLFVTHSPFILSDIVNTNILYLESGKTIIPTNQTFGANIHELLASSFFMTYGTIGKFASERINETLNWLKKKGNLKLGMDYFQIEENNSFDRDVEYHKQVIDLIGEPVIRYKLLEMYNEFVKEDPSNSKINIQD